MIDRAPAAIAAAAAAAIVAVVTAAAAVAAVAATSVFAAASPDPASGAVAAGALFSPQQVERGESAYGAWCEACHGKRLSGGEHAPPLNGDIFWDNWEGKPSRVFYSRVISTMPVDNPGVIPPGDVLDIVAYVFAGNGIAIGTKDAASPNDLSAVRITRPARASFSAGG